MYPTESKLIVQKCFSTVKMTLFFISQFADLPDPRTEGLLVGVRGSFLWFAGGFLGSGVAASATADGWLYDEGADVWREGQGLPSAVGGSCMVDLGKEYQSRPIPFFLGNKSCSCWF